MTRTNVVQLGLIVFLLGAVGYGVFLFLGFEAPKAGIASDALLVLLLMVWIGSYFFRVVGGKMTFMEQRKRYLKEYEQVKERELVAKFDSMSNEEKERFFRELEIDKNKKK